MVSYEKTETANGDGGVVHPAHPPVVDTIVLTDPTKKFKAGTVLKESAGVTTYEPAAPADALVAGKTCILVQDSDGVNGECLGLSHGMVVATRLLDHSGANAVAANATLKGKLPALGIHLTQLYVGETK